MLVYQKGQAKNTMVTLNDSKTLANPFYLFVFTHITTGEKIKTCVNSNTDLSQFPDRVNIFNISISLFAQAPSGDWQYQVFESATNTTDPSGLNLVETGKMRLNDTQLINQGYEPTPQIKGYAG